MTDREQALEAFNRIWDACQWLIKPESNAEKDAEIVKSFLSSPDTFTFTREELEKIKENLYRELNSQIEYRNITNDSFNNGVETLIDKLMEKK